MVKGICLGLLISGLWLTLPASARAQAKLPAGNGLTGVYYDGMNFERPMLVRRDAAIDFSWDKQPPAPGLEAEHFSVRWTGWLLVPATAEYEFQTVMDDGLRVWVGHKRIIDAWRNQDHVPATVRLRLEAGRYYPLRVDYFQNQWESRALLQWRRVDQPGDFAPISSRQLFAALPTSAKPLPPAPSAAAPAAQPTGGTIRMVTAPLGSRPVTATPVKPSVGVAVAGRLPGGIGLQASYYAGSVRGPVVHSRVEPVVDVTWRGAAPAPGVPGQGFAVRWTGYVYAPESGLYVFHTEWDDATDINLAGESILSMEKYEPEYFRPRKPPIPVDMVQNLTAGRFYRIDLAYKNVRGVPSRAVLSWVRPAAGSGAATLEQAFAEAKRRGLVVVPQQFLYPELPQPLPEPPAAPVAAARPTPQPAPAKLPPARPAPARSAQPAVRPASPTPRPTDTTALLPDLAALSRGAAVTLPNLYFTQSTASLLPASRPVLNALARRLRQQPALRLEVAGHTDNVGDARLNQHLSELRAQVVRRYLVQQGVDSVRLTARGYGGTRPVANNADPQQRPRNRRVEVVVQ